jgi:hypothetical protein
MFYNRLVNNSPSAKNVINQQLKPCIGKWVSTALNPRTGEG